MGNAAIGEEYEVGANEAVEHLTEYDRKGLVLPRRVHHLVFQTSQVPSLTSRILKYVLLRL